MLYRLGGRSTNAKGLDRQSTPSLSRQLATVVAVDTLRWLQRLSRPLPMDALDVDVESAAAEGLGRNVPAFGAAMAEG